MEDKKFGSEPQEKLDTDPPSLIKMYLKFITSLVNRYWEKLKQESFQEDFESRSLSRSGSDPAENTIPIQKKSDLTKYSDPDL